MLAEGLGEVTMTVWGYGLLGPVEVRVDGRAVELAGAKQRLLLAMLLLAGGQQVPAGRLVDELWGEALPRDPAGAARPSANSPAGRSRNPKPCGWTSSAWPRGSGKQSS
jgi:hypothetical protein